KLRFDFTHFAKMTKEEVSQVEKIVNQKIRENILLKEERGVPIEKAREMGAMALFGEKYGDHVRVITYDPSYSIELCGGTHVPATGQIGLFKIVSEGAIAAGIRRIEAITAGKAEEYFNQQEELLEELKSILKNPRDLVKSVNSIVEENHTLRKQVAEADKIRLEQLKNELLKKSEKIGNIMFIGAQVDLTPDNAKNLAFELSKVTESLFLVLGTECEGKANLTVMISEKLVKEKGYHAGKMIRELAKEIQGGGGGQPHIATAGGKNPAGIPKALEMAKDIIERSSEVAK
ncbi:MAG: DHHA1 domain-containing protein, partial [Bacteroidota bacterium]|nr:DHHA1 domain-containing protein [Bacteroidota bacterium]